MTTSTVEFRFFLLDLARAVLRDLGPRFAAWVPEEVAWAPGSPAPVEEVAAMGFLLSGLHEEGNVGLELLRTTDSSVDVAVRTDRGDRVVAAVPVSRSGALALATLADQLQDHAQESAAGWGHPVPECTVHGNHALTPEVLDARAVWHCPQSGEVLAEVTALGSTT